MRMSGLLSESYLNLKGLRTGPLWGCDLELVRARAPPCA